MYNLHLRENFVVTIVFSFFPQGYFLNDFSSKVGLMANNKIDTGVDKIGLADGEVRPYKDYYDDHDDDDDDDGDDDDDDDDKIGLADGEVRGFQIQKIFLLHFLI